MQKIIPLIARCLVALIFAISGVKSAVDFSDTTAALAGKGIAVPGFFAAAAIVFLLAGSLSIIFGYKAKVGALLLLIFLVPTTLLFHWNLHDQAQMTQVLKNAGLAGGLLLIITYGPGEWKIK